MGKKVNSLMDLLRESFLFSLFQRECYPSKLSVDIMNTNIYFLCYYSGNNELIWPFLQVARQKGFLFRKPSSLPFLAHEWQNNMWLPFVIHAQREFESSSNVTTGLLSSLQSVSQNLQNYWFWGTRFDPHHRPIIIIFFVCFISTI